MKWVVIHAQTSPSQQDSGLSFILEQVRSSHSKPRSIIIRPVLGFTNPILSPKKQLSDIFCPRLEKDATSVGHPGPSQTVGMPEPGSDVQRDRPVPWKHRSPPNAGASLEMQLVYQQPQVLLMSWSRVGFLESLQKCSESSRSTSAFYTHCSHCGSRGVGKGKCYQVRQQCGFFFSVL